MKLFVKDVRSKEVITSLDVDPTRSVLEIKKEIYRKTRVPPVQQRLLMELEDDHMLLSYMSKAECTIEMDEKLPEKIRIIVKTLTGKNINLVMKPLDKVLDLMNRVQAEEGIPHDQQRLIYGGKQLDEDSAADRTLFYYNIKDYSVILLILRLKGC